MVWRTDLQRSIRHHAAIMLSPVNNVGDGILQPSASISEYAAGRSTPSVACIIQPGSTGGFQKLFFGSEEIAIPVYGR